VGIYLYLTPLLLLIFPSLMALAAWTDLFTMTIPNPIPATLTLGYFAVAISIGVPANTIFQGLTCGLTILAIGFALFCSRVIGGGDAKFAAAIGLWIGWAAISDFAMNAAICGGAISLTLLAARKYELPKYVARQPWISRLWNQQAGVPYGIALAGAGLMQYAHSPIWRVAVT
jgi:prepilin peptidase CpaA